MNCQGCGKEFEGISGMLVDFALEGSGGSARTEITATWCDALCKNGLRAVRAWRVRYCISKLVSTGYLEAYFTHFDIKSSEVLAAFCSDGDEPEDFEEHRKRILAGDYQIEEVKLIERRLR